jgi:hypothetical protein
LVSKIVTRSAPGLVTDIRDPQSIGERRGAAEVCEISFLPGIITVVDEMDDRVSKAYAARPTRLYLIGEDGRVVYAGGLGPFGFRPAELQEAIGCYLAEGH